MKTTLETLIQTIEEKTILKERNRVLSGILQLAKENPKLYPSRELEQLRVLVLDE